MTGRNLLALSFRIVGLVFGVLAAVTAVYSAVFVARSYLSDGTVVGHSTVRNSISVMPESESTGVLYYPVVAYHDTSGAERRFTGPRGRSAPAFKDGESVRVRVSAVRPDDARLATVLGVWGSTVVLSAIAAIFLLLGYAAPYGFGGLRRPS